MKRKTPDWTKVPCPRCGSGLAFQGERCRRQTPTVLGEYPYQTRPHRERVDAAPRVCPKCDGKGYAGEPGKARRCDGPCGGRSISPRKRAGQAPAKRRTDPTLGGFLGLPD